MSDRSRIILLPLGMIAAVALFLVVERFPSLFGNPMYLGAILALQVALIGLSNFEAIFFPLLMGNFLWAGSRLPFSSVGMALRWLFLALGAFAGFVIWIKSTRQRHFAAVHLIALFCVVSALVSAMVSEVPNTALLKVASLFLLFLYASSGGRIAIAGREQKFLKVLVLACEGLAILSALCYFVLDYPVFGNPNSLGAILGIAVVPVLLWGAIVAETRGMRQRRFFALALCCGLLYLANSRASILTAVSVVIVFTMALRRPRLLLQCAFFSVFFLAIMAVVSPSHVAELFSTLTGRLVYKEQGTHHGVFGSRLSPWTDTFEVVKRHPWFGSGFGTSELGELRPHFDSSAVYTIEGTNREHGNSYFALAEYMGIFGSLPFLMLLLLLIFNLGRIYTWERRNLNPHHPSVPFALVVFAGLTHACFEDWMFAVGSYLCVFFWVSAFGMMDIIPEATPQWVPVAFLRQPRGVVPAPPAVPALRG